MRACNHDQYRLSNRTFLAPKFVISKPVTAGPRLRNRNSNANVLVPLNLSCPIGVSSTLAAPLICLSYPIPSGSSSDTFTGPLR